MGADPENQPDEGNALPSSIAGKVDYAVQLIEGRLFVPKGLEE